MGFPFPTRLPLHNVQKSLPDKGAKFKVRIAEIKSQLLPAVADSARGNGGGGEDSGLLLPDGWVEKISKSKGKV